MSRVFEWVFSGLLNVSTFFENLRQNRHDDQITAEYRAKQRACLWSLVAFFAVLLVGWAAGIFLNVVGGFQGAGAPVEDARAWVLPIFWVAIWLAVAFALFTWVSLYRFIKRHKIE